MAEPTRTGRTSHFEDKGDLGFGSTVAAESTARLLNKDGSFNVRRRGLGVFRSQSLYHWAIGLTWPRFLMAAALNYFAINLVFALLYLACGGGALIGADAQAMGGSFWRAFFFSIETFATIGYGEISPVGIPAHMIMVFEALVALMTQALITGLLFARFARPTAAIRFSKSMVVAPFQGGRGLMFRIANRHDNQLIDLKARVTASWIERTVKGEGRRFRQLVLERSDVIFFPLAWTLVHPINDESPLYGLSDEDLRRTDFEFLCIITAIDEAFAQVVHARTSFKSHEVVWGAKFTNIFLPPDDRGRLAVDIERIDEYDRMPLPAQGES
jgi:inward rectifier potassium channel